MPWGIAAAAVVGAAASSDASRRAANAQKNAANTASNTELEMFNQNRADMQPWRQAGMGALSQLSSGLGVRQEPKFNEQAYLAARPDAAAWLQQKQAEGDPKTAFDHYTADGARQQGVFTAPEEGANFNEFNRNFTLADFNKDPGYQFRMDEGMKALEGSAAARGNALSGGALKGIARYGQDYASGEYQNAYNRYNNDLTTRFNRLSGLAGTGQTATRDVANMGSQVAQNIGQNQIGAGNARASGYIGQANAVNDAISGAQSGYQLSQLNKNRAVQPSSANYTYWNSGTGGAGNSSSGTWGGSASEPWYG